MNKFFGKKMLLFDLIIAMIAIGILLSVKNVKNADLAKKIMPMATPTITPTPPNPLSIAAMRDMSYPGSDITIEKTLASGTGYNQYIASYLSDGNKINALLTIPTGKKPETGWPVIIFNHGYIPPEEYTTTGRYVAYVDYFARNGYIVFKSDYRGNGDSEGQPTGAYFSNGYAVDILNAITSLKHYKDADPSRIGMWVHSMGGNITLRALVVDPEDIKVAVIWGGVVGSYQDILYNWHRATPFQPSAREVATRRGSTRSAFLNQYQTPEKNPTFWNSIDPTYFVKDITAPIQLDVGGADEEVPIMFSEHLRDMLKTAGKTVEFYEYPGSDHNISQGFSEAMKNSLDFFNKYLKNS